MGMKELQNLENDDKKLIAAFDWPTSPNVRETDSAAWTQIGELCARWEGTAFVDEGIFKELRLRVYGTRWFSLYMGLVKGCLRSATLARLQADRDVECLLLEGGPISRCEEWAMPLIVDECLRELEQLLGTGYDHLKNRV